MNAPQGFTEHFSLEPNDGRRLASVCGQFHEHLKLLEESLSVSIHHRGNHFHIEGAAAAARTARHIIESLFRETLSRDYLDSDDVHLLLRASQEPSSEEERNELLLYTRSGAIRPRGANQQHYVRSILDKDISFGVGPAGTGKTYLAVACAVHLLERDEIRRILLVRPAVEAGEKLGFLPGDLAEKINPYLRPLYDALYEMLGFERVGKLIEKNVIEVAPLAYMRGRTLNHSFIILDEGQNTTPEQMKMFLTRLGFGSKAVITGDITQVDLPKGQQSGLAHAIEVLRGVKAIHITRFGARDVLRHQLVQSIVEAYDHWDANHTSNSSDDSKPRRRNNET